MLNKRNKKKNVNVLLCVQNFDVIPTNNLHIVTRQGTKTGSDNPRISKIKNKDDYPNPIKKKQLYNDSSNMFQEFSTQEVTDFNRQNVLQEILNLIYNDK